MTTMAEMAAAEMKAAHKRWDVGGDLAVVTGRRSTAREARAMTEIVDLVASAAGISKRDILGPSRLRHIARARQYSYHLSALEGFSTVAIGAFFSRDHTTVRHGILATRARLEEVRSQ